MLNIKLNNAGCCRSNVYYPRLMINKYQEIVLATSQSENGLTTGIYMGQADEHEPRWPIGKRFDDWEVAGQLVDYDGPVTVRFENKVKKNES